MSLNDPETQELLTRISTERDPTKLMTLVERVCHLLDGDDPHQAMSDLKQRKSRSA
jgi:hypothetical protein